MKDNVIFNLGFFLVEFLLCFWSRFLEERKKKDRLFVCVKKKREKRVKCYFMVSLDSVCSCLFLKRGKIFCSNSLSKYDE